MPAKPTLDDQFWFDFSKETVQQAGARRHEAAGKAATLIAWLWGVYTAAVAVGVTLSKESYPWWVLLLLVAPTPVLLIAYWCATWAQMPSVLSFDPRSPDDIRVAHDQNLQVKTGRLQSALALCLLAALGVAGAIVAASVTKGIRTETTLNAMWINDPGTPKVAVTGTFPPNTLVQLLVLPSAAVAATQPSAPVRHPVLSTGEGLVQTVVEVLFSPDASRVRAEWEQEGIAHTIAVPTKNASSQR